MRALNVRERLQSFCNNHRPVRGSKGVIEDILTAEHWTSLELLETALQDFFEATMMTQGQQNNLSEYFCTLDYLLNAVNTTKETYKELRLENPSPENAFLEAAADASWNHIEKYYNMLDTSPAYYAAAILDPCTKWGWFEQEWENDTVKADWLVSAKEKVKKLWEEEYKGVTSSIQSDKETPDTDAFVKVREHKRIKTNRPVPTDRYMIYCNTDRDTALKTGRDNALAYWNLRYESQPDLSRFAYDMLSIPCMADDCERQFSSAKLLLSHTRSRLLPDIIEANELLRAWLGCNAADSFDEEEENELPVRIRRY